MESHEVRGLWKAGRAGKSLVLISGVPAPRAWTVLHLGRELVTGSDLVSHPPGNASTKRSALQTPQMPQ